MSNETDAENRAILLHDIRAVMVNYSGLQHEVQTSLQQLSVLLQSITCVDNAHENTCNTAKDEPIYSQIGEIFEEDIDQCLPMLQVTSEKLTVLLKRFVSGDDDDVLSSDSTHQVEVLSGHK